MKRVVRKAPGRPRRNAAETLLEAAALEFNERGFFGTDTNRIARRAGFAPQTFYRNYASKTAIFIAVYDRWQAEDQRAVAAALAPLADDDDAARRVASILIASHRRWRYFRRSLRLLALEDTAVRAARAASRLRQLQRLSPANDPPTASQIAALLTVERLCDAAADDEIEDLGLTSEPWVAVVAAAFLRLRAAA